MITQQQLPDEDAEEAGLPDGGASDAGADAAVHVEGTQPRNTTPRTRCTVHSSKWDMSPCNPPRRTDDRPTQQPTCCGLKRGRWQWCNMDGVPCGKGGQVQVWRRAAKSTSETETNKTKQHDTHKITAETTQPQEAL